MRAIMLNAANTSMANQCFMNWFLADIMVENWNLRSDAIKCWLLNAEQVTHSPAFPVGLQRQRARCSGRFWRYLHPLLLSSMVSLYRTINNIRRAGLREWWRQMQYIGDAKFGRHVGTDQFVSYSFTALQLIHMAYKIWKPILWEFESRGGSSWYESYFSIEKRPSHKLAQGRHRWVDYAQVYIWAIRSFEKYYWVLQAQF